MFATKLQGASLFLLICRDLQGSDAFRERGPERATQRCVPVSVPDGAEESSNCGPGGGIIPAAPFPRASRRKVPSNAPLARNAMVRARSADVLDRYRPARIAEPCRIALRRAEAARRSGRPDEEAAWLLLPHACHQHASVRHLLRGPGPDQERVVDDPGRGRPRLRVRAAGFSTS